MGTKLVRTLIAALALTLFAGSTIASAQVIDTENAPATDSEGGGVGGAAGIPEGDVDVDGVGALAEKDKRNVLQKIRDWLRNIGGGGRGPTTGTPAGDRPAPGPTPCANGLYGPNCLMTLDDLIAWCGQILDHWQTHVDITESTVGPDTIEAQYHALIMEHCSGLPGFQPV